MSRHPLLTLLLVMILSALAYGSTTAKPCDPVGHLRVRPKNPSQWVRAGSNRTLLCFEGTTDGLYTHFKWIDPQGMTVTRDQTATIHTKRGSDGLYLKFIEPTFVESGNYTCRALYQGTLVEISTAITFIERLSSKDCPPVQDLIVGQTGVIRCGGPNDTIVGIQSQNESDGRFQLQQPTLNRNEVLLGTVLRGDAGTYVLSVKGAIATSRYVVEVRVHDTPDTDEPQNSLKQIDDYEASAQSYVVEAQTFAVVLLAAIPFVLIVVVILVDVIRFYRSRTGILHALSEMRACRVFYSEERQTENL